MLTRSVGTKLYASPEQLASSDYDHKSDIYSLAINLFRILYSTFTQMETLKTIESLRKGELKPNFVASFPIISEVLKSSLKKEPKERPELDEIEKALLNQELQTFRKVRYPDQSKLSVECFDSLENKLGVGRNTNILSAEISVELDSQIKKSCILIMQNEEMMVFFENETKSRQTLVVREYIFILHPKKKAVSLKDSVKADVNLYFSTKLEYEMLVNFGQDLGCNIY